MNPHCNEANMLKVRAFILANPGKFDMDQFGDDFGTMECKSACCIAGWAARMSENKDEIITEAAIEYLDLDRTVARKLFYAHFDCGNTSVIPELDCITPEQAAEAINNVITYGIPHWQKIVSEAGNETAAGSFAGNETARKEI